MNKWVITRVETDGSSDEVGITKKLFYFASFEDATILKEALDKIRTGDHHYEIREMPGNLKKLLDKLCE